LAACCPTRFRVGSAITIDAAKCRVASGYRQRRRSGRYWRPHQAIPILQPIDRGTGIVARREGCRVDRSGTSTPHKNINDPVDKGPPHESQLQQAAEPGWLTHPARVRT